MGSAGELELGLGGLFRFMEATTAAMQAKKIVFLLICFNWLVPYMLRGPPSCVSTIFFSHVQYNGRPTVHAVFRSFFFSYKWRIEVK